MGHDGRALRLEAEAAQALARRRDTVVGDDRGWGRRVFDQYLMILHLLNEPFTNSPTPSTSTSCIKVKARTYASIRGWQPKPWPLVSFIFGLPPLANVSAYPATGRVVLAEHELETIGQQRL
jgi:hypothetical protein